MARFPIDVLFLSEGSVKTDVPGVSAAFALPVRVHWTAAQAATSAPAGVHAAVTDNGAPQTITAGFTAPPCPRNITATAGGVGGDIKAIQVIVTGTNYRDEVITETLPVFTVNTPGIVVGNKAFKTVTSVLIPAHDGTGATTAIGFGEKLGLPYYLEVANTVTMAALAGVRESSGPTVTADATHIESDTATLTSTLNGTAVDVLLIV